VLKDPHRADQELVALNRDDIATRMVGSEAAAPSMVRKIGFGALPESL
jgi:hypothetical protein